MNLRLDKFALAYIAFVISVIFYGNTYIVAGVSLRNTMYVIMMLFCLRLNAFRIDKYWQIYIGYIIFYSISAIFDDNIPYLVHYLLGYFGLSYILYISTEQYIKRRCNIELLLNVILAFAFINSITTILQVISPDMANRIIAVMRTASSGSWDYIQTYHADEALSFSMAGIFENAVENGYWSMFFLLLPVYKFGRDNDSKCYCMFWLFIYCCILLGLFVCQQRTPIVVAGLFSLFYFLKIKPELKLYFAIALFLFMIYGVSKIEWDSLGRLSKIAELGEREDIYKTCRDFIADNWLLGGIKSYNNHYDFWPHNFFYNAFIYGGIFGFIAVVTLLWKHVIIIVRYLIKKDSDSLVTLFALAYLGVTLNSLFHNLSLPTGSPIVWLLWGLFLFSKNKLGNRCKFY